MIRVSGHGKMVVTGRLWRIAVLTAAGAIGAASQAEAALYYWSDSEPGFSRPAPAASQRRQKPRRNAAKKIEAPEDFQTAGTADHRDLDRSAKTQGLRRQRILRGNADFHRHARPFDADGRLQRHPETQAAPLQHLQRRADAVHAADHVVGRRHACRRAARLSGFPRLHPHADGVRREDVELDQDGRPRRRHPRRDDACRILASAARRTEGWRRSRLPPTNPKTISRTSGTAGAPKADKATDAGAGREARGFRSEPRAAIDPRTQRRRQARDGRARGLWAAARTDPHRGCQRRSAGQQRPAHDVRCVRRRIPAARGHRRAGRTARRRSPPMHRIRESKIRSSRTPTIEPAKSGRTTEAQAPTQASGETAKTDNRRRREPEGRRDQD